MKPTTYLTKDDWLAARKQGLGATDLGVILGVSPWKSPLALYAEKLDLLPPDEAESEAMEWGLLLEGAIAQRYGVKTQRPVLRPDRYTIYRREPEDVIAATFDGFTEQAGDPGVLEIKNVGAQKAEEWKDEPPLLYQIQLQAQLYVSGYTWGSLAALVGGQKFVYFDLERNDRFIALLVEKAAEFWAKVQKQEPPTMQATDSRLMSLLYPSPVAGAEVMLPPEALDWDHQRHQAQEQLKHWKSVLDEADALLKGHIGNAELGILPDGSGAFTWKEVHRKAYEVKETSYRELRRKAIKS